MYQLGESPASQSASNAENLPGTRCHRCCLSHLSDCRDLYRRKGHLMCTCQAVMMSHHDSSPSRRPPCTPHRAYQGLTFRWGFVEATECTCHGRPHDTTHTLIGASEALQGTPPGTLATKAYAKSWVLNGIEQTKAHLVGGPKARPWHTISVSWISATYQTPMFCA